MTYYTDIRKNLLSSPKYKPLDRHTEPEVIGNDQKSTSIYIEVELFEAINKFNRMYTDDKIQRSAVCRAALKSELMTRLKMYGMLTQFKKIYPLLRRTK